MCQALKSGRGAQHATCKQPNNNPTLPGSYRTILVHRFWDNIFRISLKLVMTFFKAWHYLQIIPILVPVYPQRASTSEFRVDRSASFLFSGECLQGICPLGFVSESMCSLQTGLSQSKQGETPVPILKTSSFGASASLQAHERQETSHTGMAVT